MLIHSRTKLNTKKLNSSLSISSNPILSSNPQIQILVDKLQIMSQAIPQIQPKTLNLIKWQKQKYRPNQIQNRIRIENQISLIKICNEKVRSRIKPIKRALSIDLSQSLDKTYKQHYQQIKQAHYRKFNSSQPQSQQEFQNASITPFNIPPKQSNINGIKYYQNLKKYDKIVQFIQDKRTSQSQLKKPKFRSTNSYTLPTSSNSKIQDVTPFKKQYSMTTKVNFIELKDKQSNSRVTSIVKKWKPLSKIEKIFIKTSKKNSINSKKLDWNNQIIPIIVNPQTNIKDEQQNNLNNEDQIKSQLFIQQ